MIAWLKNLSRTKKAALLAALVIGGLFVAHRALTATNWIDVGKGGPKRWQDFPYRLIELTGAEHVPTTHPDLTALVLSLQARRSIDAWVYLPVGGCHSPDVHYGIPTVLCKSSNGADVYIASADNVREVLLDLENRHQIAAVQGRAQGLIADTPVIWVFDPLLKAGSLR